MESDEGGRGMAAQKRHHEAPDDDSAAPTGDGRPASAALPSPFPPIAEYAFLSDCHTGCLVAPDGSVDWLCVPRFDSASVFGSLLDREAGMFRFGPFGINVPSARRYEPGTNVLETTWKTPQGWVVVRDALDARAEHRRRPRHAAHSAADRRRCRAHARARRRVPQRAGGDRAGVRAGVRLRPGTGRLEGRRRRCARRRGDRRRRHASNCTPTCASGSRPGGCAAGTCSRPATGCTARCTWAHEFAAPTRRRRRRGAARCHGAVLATVVGSRRGSPIIATGRRSNGRRWPSRD